MRRWRNILVLLVVMMLCVRSRGLTVVLAQTREAEPANTKAVTAPGGHDAPGQPAAEPVKLGESAVELAGPWRFHPGDNMAWAAPGFDDAGWAPMDLSVPGPASDPTMGRTGYLPGWTARGYPELSGFAWYRLRVEVSGAKRTLSLKMPDSADDAYQVFANGQQIGEFGKFQSGKVTAYGSVPLAFRLPRNVRDGLVVIAVRMWMDSATPFSTPDAGGLHAPPVLGFTASIASEVRMYYDQIAHSLGSGFLEMLILLMALLMAGALFWLDVHERAYLWLALVCIVTMVGNSVTLFATFGTPVAQTAGEVVADILARPIRIGLWVIFWGYWFRLARMSKLHFLVWSLVAALALATAMLRPPLFGEHVPVAAAVYLKPLALVLKLLLGGLLFTVAVYGFKRQKAEGGLAAAAVLLAFVALFQSELRQIHLSIRTSIFGFAISLGQISTILSLLIITVMLLRRFVHSQRQQELWRLEIEQAQHVQQVLIPDKFPVIQGLKIQSEYRPHREVGGDFFQILPREIAGAPLIVVGDVTGKGLQAGMLVALIVGSIRTAAQHSSDPAYILQVVNDQLCEREHASATCMILRFRDGGTVDLAHAGHLPPYLNGMEMQVEGALPLGMICGIDFPSLSFHLQPGDALTLMSDGIAEAQDSHGQLFGFERVNRMLEARATPADIATAAQKFGQADDILVLRAQWTGEGVSEPQVGSQLAPV